MKETLKTNEDDLDFYYGEWHITGELEKFLNLTEGKKLKITIEVVE